MRRSSPVRWQILREGVSLRTTLLALIPIGLWIVFLFAFVLAYRAILHIVHVEGPVAIVMLVLRSVVELVSAMLAFKYFFDIIARGIEREQSADTKHHT